LEAIRRCFPTGTPQGQDATTAILEQLDFRPCIDAEDPDDYRPRSSWAVAADEVSRDRPFVKDSVLPIAEKL
jgi:hypothetical protein